MSPRPGSQTAAFCRRCQNNVKIGLFVWHLGKASANVVQDTWHFESSCHGNAVKADLSYFRFFIPSFPISLFALFLWRSFSAKQFLLCINHCLRHSITLNALKLLVSKIFSQLEKDIGKSRRIFCRYIRSKNQFPCAPCSCNNKDRK